MDENSPQAANLPPKGLVRSVTKTKLRPSAVRFESAQEKEAFKDEQVSELLHGRPSLFRMDKEIEGISRIEAVLDADEVEHQSEEANKHGEVEEIMKFKTSIQGFEYVVTILQGEIDIFASFLKLIDESRQVRKLPSAWRKPPIKEGMTSEEWYMQNIGSVLLRSRGPAVTPKQPPKRRPPQAEMGALSVIDASVDGSEVKGQPSLRSEGNLKQRHEQEIARLRIELEASKKALSDSLDEHQRTSAHFDECLKEWQNRLAVAESGVDSSKLEWSRLLAERDGEIHSLKVKMKQDADSLRGELDLARQASHLSTSQVIELQIKLSQAQGEIKRLLELYSPQTNIIKLSRTEAEIWAEAEHVLSLSRNDVEEARVERDAAVLRATKKEVDANEAIVRCEQFMREAKNKVASLEAELKAIRSVQ